MFGDALEEGLEVLGGEVVVLFGDFDGVVGVVGGVAVGAVDFDGVPGGFSEGDLGGDGLSVGEGGDLVAEGVEGGLVVGVHVWSFFLKNLVIRWVWVV